MAGGRGTRLLPLTASLPKPLIPIAGQPILYHVLRLLERHGIKEAIVTTQYRAGQIQEYLDGLDGFDLSISCVTEEAPLGTAGGFKVLVEHLRGGSFLVISGDALTDCDLSELIESHRRNSALVTVGLAEVADPLGFGVVTTDRNGRINRFIEKPAAGTEPSNQVNTGIYVMEPGILDRIPAGQAVDWARNVFPGLVEKDAPIYGCPTDAYWEDVGTHDRYHGAQADALAGKVRVELDCPEVAPGVWFEDGVLVPPDATLVGPLYVGAGVVIGAGATLANGSVVGAGTVVGAGSVLDGAICHEAARIGPGSVLVDCIVGAEAHIGASARIGRRAVIGARSVVADGAVIPQGARIEPAVARLLPT
ncbi:sugar phosphate nucleotidyltransferase [Kitasatospora sp. NPDC001159]